MARSSVSGSVANFAYNATLAHLLKNESFDLYSLRIGPSVLSCSPPVWLGMVW